MGLNWVETKPAGETTKNWEACRSSLSGLYLLAVERDLRSDKCSLYLSSNGGTSWSKIDPSGNEHSADLIAMSNSGEIMLVGYPGSRLVYQSVNYGAAWTSIAYPGKEDECAYLASLNISGDGVTLFVVVDILDPK